MKQLFADLWQSEPESPFPNMSTRAYLLTRPAGNVLIYNSTLESTYQAIEEHGGLAYHVISHRDEVAGNLTDVKKRFGSLLVAHERDQAAVERVSPVDMLITAPGELIDAIRVIPTPGHSPGSMCLVYDSPAGERYLFTGDTIYPQNDTWGVYVSPGNRPVLAESLELLKGLNPDVVFSSASVGPDSYRRVSGAEWDQTLDEAIHSLR